MTKTLEPPRTPLWAMTDEQLRCYADDELATYEKRQMATMLLAARRREAQHNAARPEDVDGVEPVDHNVTSEETA